MPKGKGKKKGNGGKGKDLNSGGLAPRSVLDAYATLKKRRDRARLHFKASIVREMESEDKKYWSEFQVPLEDIRYASDSFDANKFASEALIDIAKEGCDVYCGFDTEGSIKVLQLDFAFGSRTYSHVYQLNKIVYDGKAPEKLQELLAHENLVFTGKKVNDELIEVLEMCGVEPERIRTARIVETQRTFEVIEMVARGDRYAYKYLEFGQYSPDYALPKDPFAPIDKQKQEDLGLKTLFRFFYPKETISKCYELRCPLFVDWSCLNEEMTDRKLKYAATDGATGRRALEKGDTILRPLGFGWTDLIERVDMEMSRNKNGPFLSGKLAQHFRKAMEKDLSRSESEGLEAFRKKWRAQIADAIEEETDLRMRRHERISELQKEWDRANDYVVIRDGNGEDDEPTVACAKMNDEDLEFENVKYEYKQGHEVHTRACLLRAELDSHRRKILLFEQGIDILAAEEESRKESSAWGKRAFENEMSTPSTSRDPDYEERLRKIQDKKREREADPEIFAACGNLQIIVDKCRAEAEKCVRLQAEEKDRQEAERREEEEREERAREEEDRKEEERAAEEEKERVLKAAKTAEEEMRRAERRQELLRKLAEDEKRRKDREEERERKALEQQQKVKDEYEAWKLEEAERDEESNKRLDRLEGRVERAREALKSAMDDLTAEKTRDEDRRQASENTRREWRRRIQAFVEEHKSVSEDEDDEISDGDTADDIESGAAGPEQDSQHSDAQETVKDGYSSMEEVQDVRKFDADFLQIYNEETLPESEESIGISGVEPLPASLERIVESVEEAFVSSTPSSSKRVVVDPDNPAPKRIRTGGVCSDANVLNECDADRVAFYVQGIFRDSKRLDGATYFAEVLEMVTSQDRRLRIVRSVLNRLERKSDRARFSETVIRNCFISEELITAASMLDYYEMDPIIVVDHLHHAGAQDHVLTNFVKAYPRNIIEGTVRQLHSLAAMNQQEAIEYLRDLPVFPENYLSDRPDDKRCRREWFLRLARSLCKIHGLDCPEAVQKFPLNGLLGQIVRASQRGELQKSDFMSEMEARRSICGAQPEEVVEALRDVFPSAARFVAQIYDVGVDIPESGQRFEDAKCNGNARLHDFGKHVTCVYVDSTPSEHLAIKSITKSELLVARVSTITRKFSPKQLTVFAMRTDDCFIIMAIEAVKDERRASFVRRMRTAVMNRRILVWDPTHFHEFTVPFGRPIPGVVDFHQVAWYVKIGKSWDSLSRALTGGAMCMTASFLAGYETPSLAAVEHENIRLSLLFEFYRKNLKAVSSAPVQPVSAQLMKKLGKR